MSVSGGSVLTPLRFGEFVLDEAGFALRRGGQPVAIEPRALKLLLHSPRFALSRRLARIRAGCALAGDSALT